MARITIVLALVFAVAMISAKLMNVRDQVPNKFIKLSRANPNQLHTFSLALKQKNLDVLEATLLDVADPESPNYGKWWTTQQILDLIAPSSEEVKPVIAWLESAGVRDIDVSGRDFIKVKAPISVIERMFSTQMHNFQSTEHGAIVPRVFGEVHIPDHLTVIDMVMGLTELVPKSIVGGKTKFVSKRDVEQNTDPLGYIYPGQLRNMYQIPTKYWVNTKNSYGVAEFDTAQNGAYQASDMTAFNKGMNEKVAVNKIVGTFLPNNPSDESTLDVQYGASLALNTTFWYWTADNWMYEFATGFFNAQNFPLAVSMSWGWPEDLQCQITASCPTGSTQDSFNYVKKVNVEFMKIGLKGVTLLAASGDQGAPGDEDQTCAGTISNIFPGASPWVTSVGATMLAKPSSSNAKRQANQPPVCQQMNCATITTETSCSFPTAIITTGGGFSYVSSVPAWQKDVVRAYLNSGVVLPTGQFNASNRAFPDVAANGHNYLIYMQNYGGFVQVDGTSASSPVFGAVISLLNSYLFDHGKTSIGFANPLLYKMYAADKTTFTDITTGNNYCTESCCGTVGFVATKGWDAVTGLGTPMFPRMQAYLKNNVIKN